ncbi:hypothetical protein V6000_002117 [Aspergillus fumigatus]
MTTRSSTIIGSHSSLEFGKDFSNIGHLWWHGVSFDLRNDHGRQIKWLDTWHAARNRPDRHRSVRIWGLDFGRPLLLVRSLPLGILPLRDQDQKQDDFQSSYLTKVPRA